MKKLWFGLILVCLIVVSVFAESNSEKNLSYNDSLPLILDTTIHRLFKANDIPSLGLESVGSFWNDDSIQTTGRPILMFTHYPEYLGGREYRGRKKAISISIFASQSTAFEATEKMRFDIAPGSIPGSNHDELSGNWWYIPSFDYIIFVNQGNTIIGVSYNSHTSYKEVEGELIAAAKEIVARMKAITAKK